MSEAYEYDYDRYEQILLKLLKVMWRDADDLEIGRDISDIPAVKIIFDGHGYNEETGEQDNTNVESYAIFVHRDSGTDDFQFPEHELTPWALIHRPAEEVCIYAWYDVEHDEWSINGLGETSEHAMTDQEVMTVLEALDRAWFHLDDDPDVADTAQATVQNDPRAWPFPRSK
jgi:hypothetical protein